MFLAGGIGLLGMASKSVPNPIGIVIGISSATAIALKGPAFVNNIEGLIQATEQIYSKEASKNNLLILLNRVLLNSVENFILWSFVVSL